MGLLAYGSMDRRFFHALGASLLDRTICASAGAAGYKATVGEDDRARPRGDRPRAARSWPGAPTSSARTCTSGRSSRRRGGAGRGSSCIDPYRSRTAEKSDLHLAPCPGTDAALALGMMHVIFRDGLEDRD